MYTCVPSRPSQTLNPSRHFLCCPTVKHLHPCLDFANYGFKMVTASLALLSIWRKSQRSRTRCASKTTAADVNQAEKDPVDALMLFHVFSNVHAVKRAREPGSAGPLCSVSSNEKQAVSLEIKAPQSDCSYFKTVISVQGKIKRHKLRNTLTTPLQVNLTTTRMRS